MSYDQLRDRLERLPDAPREIVALPDGSVDRLYAPAGTGGDRLESREAFVQHLRSGADTVPLESLAVRPGGQATNAATQAHALGDDATLVGYLDHAAFDDLPFETRSMGTPARITVVAFDDQELMLPDPGPTDDWRLDDLLAVLEWDRLTGADALCCVNWVSIRGLTAVFDRLASAALADRDAPLPVVVDPGALELVEPTAVADFLETLARADSSAGVEVVLSVNPTELEAAVAAVDGNVPDVDTTASEDTTPTADSVASLRSSIGITGVVSHGSAAAVGAYEPNAASGTSGSETDDGDGDTTRAGAKSATTSTGTTATATTATVPMLEVDDPQLTTGAGDRFSGGLACALARGWPLSDALALGNACAASFVATGETAAAAELQSFCRDHDVSAAD